MRTIKCLYKAIRLSVRMKLNQQVNINIVHAFRYYYGVSLRERRLNGSK